MKAKNHLSLVLLCLTVCMTHVSHAQVSKRTEHNTLELLYAMPWWARLKENRERIEGSPELKNGTVYNYLEHVRAHPECVDVVNFRRSKVRYNQLVMQYNGIIQYLIDDVNELQAMPLQEIRIDITKYKDDYRKLQDSIPVFLRDLELELAQVNSNEPCHRASTVTVIDGIMDFVVIPLINWFKKRRLEELKNIIVRELEKLKLDPSDTWDEIERLLMHNELKPVIQNAPVEAVYRSSELECCRMLHLRMDACYDSLVVNESYNLRTADIVQSLEKLEANDTKGKEYYQELLAEYTQARDILLAKRCKTETIVNDQLAEKLRNHLNTLILINSGSGCIPVEQMKTIMKDLGLD
jgi:hypothetical protein